MSFGSCVGELKRSYFNKNCSEKFGRRVEVSGTWKFHVKVSKSCIVNFCYCFFIGVFKNWRANFLPSSCFSVNLLVRVGKILLTGGWSQTKKWNKQVFQMLAIWSTISFPNGAKCRKYVGPGCSLPHLP